MEIKRSDFGKSGVFYMEDNGIQVSALNYTYSGDTKIIINHTEVLEAYEGRGLGKALVHAVVDFAREKHIKILPLCPFAKNVMEKNSEFQDVLF